MTLNTFRRFGWKRQNSPPKNNKKQTNTIKIPHLLLTKPSIQAHFVISPPVYSITLSSHRTAHSVHAEKAHAEKNPSKDLTRLPVRCSLISCSLPQSFCMSETAYISMDLFTNFWGRRLPLIEVKSPPRFSPSYKPPFKNQTSKESQGKKAKKKEKNRGLLSFSSQLAPNTLFLSCAG